MITSRKETKRRRFGAYPEENVLSLNSLQITLGIYECVSKNLKQALNFISLNK